MGTNSSAIVQDNLAENNYANWSILMENYLSGQGLWDIISSTESEQKENEPEFKKKNAMALHAIQISCGPDILCRIGQIKSAKTAWNVLKSHQSKLKPQGRTRGRVRSSGDYAQYVPLLKAVESGKWVDAKNFLDSDREAVRARISSTGKTALHVAAIAGHVKIVEELVELMSEQDLEILSERDGCTALMAAAGSGITQMALRMVKKNKKLVSIAAMDGMIPLVMAAVNAHKDMVRYLYGITPKEELTPEKGTNGATFLTNCIVGEILDVALDLLQKYPRLAFALDRDGYSPVYVLSQMPSAFQSSGSDFAFWRCWIYSRIYICACRCICVDIQMIAHRGQTHEAKMVKPAEYSPLHRPLSCLLKLFGIKHMYDRKLIHIQAFEILHCICEQIPSLSEKELETGLVKVAVFEAVKHGIVEFVTETIKANPNLLEIVDRNDRDIFLSAIVYRQEKIFSLIYGLEARRGSLTSRVDRFENNMLHLAGMLAPSTRLGRIPGAALQMQLELQWFKEVEHIVHPKCKKLQNLDCKRPGELFSENHMNLVKEGEKWMKEAATSCTVAAALILTIMFAAAFTVPGGNDQNTGFPMFLERDLFMVFIISDAISFFSSSTSVLVFLGILTSRYAEEYFLKSLPKKMIIGLTTLFISIATMMIAFSAALFLMLRGESTWVFTPIIVLASVPITIFVLLQFPLLVKIFLST